MAQHNDIGEIGEGLARDYLKNKGYQIREMNWQISKNEIDIIAEDNEYLVFVEVKTRSTNYWGEPELFVNRQKQRFMVKAANAYVQKTDSDKEVRFDIVAVLLSGGKHKIHHIEDAFYPLL